jgi:hypothetical protein
MAPEVEASYGYSAEMTYRKIAVKGGKLRYTYNAKNSKVKPGEHVTAQQPHYIPSDLVTKEAALSTAELGALAKQIRTSGFLKLKSVYDDRPGYRAYPVSVFGGVDGKRHTVSVMHGPAPKPSRDLADALKKLVRKHLPSAPKPR